MHESFGVAGPPQASVAIGAGPAPMSFDDSLLEICDFFLLATGRAPGNSTALYRKLCSQRALLVAQKRRPRRYPREVKIKMSSDDHKDV